MSLRWRIALALAAIAAATTIAVGVASYRAISERLVEEVDDGLYQALTSLALDESALDEGGPLDVYFVQLVRRNGQRRGDPRSRPSRSRCPGRRRCAARRRC